MIPRHRPPFDIVQLALATAKALTGISVEQVEASFTEITGLPYAVWLPSARAGINWALRAALTKDMTVIGPAYTCQVVHEAMARSGAQVLLVDTDENGFLMNPKFLESVRLADYVLVLCELYGHAYDLSLWNNSVLAKPRLRIVDAAMTVPVPAVFDRLEESDFAVVSFGIGKCVYAGWGGMGLTRNKVLADDVRAQRNASVHQTRRGLGLRRGVEIWLRTLAHNRIFYGALRRMQENRKMNTRCSAGDTAGLAVPSLMDGDQKITREWYLPSTAIDRYLVLQILDRVHQLSEDRSAHVRRYRDRLSGVRDLILPPLSPHAMSHYTIRVPCEARNAIRGSLCRSGVDTGTLFNFPQYLSRDEFPNAYRLSLEVINLPLDASLRVTDVDRICSLLIKCIEGYGRERRTQ